MMRWNGKQPQAVRLPCGSFLFNFLFFFLLLFWKCLNKPPSLELFSPYGSLPWKKGKRKKTCQVSLMSLPAPALWTSCQCENGTQDVTPHSTLSARPRMEPGCQMSTFFFSFLAKMSSLWQDHIHNKAFIFLITLFFFVSLYIDIYIPFVLVFTTVSSPQWRCATKKEQKAQLHLRGGGADGRAATHDNTQPARAKKGHGRPKRSRGRGPGAPPQNGSLLKKTATPRRSLSLEKLPHAAFSVLLVFFSLLLIF